MQCPACHATIDDDVTRCRHCAFDLEEVTTPDEWVNFVKLLLVLAAIGAIAWIYMSIR